MKTSLYIIVTIILLFGSAKISAQVKIGDNPTTVNPASLLELESGNKGLLLPRLADTTSISNPPPGMLIFDKKDTSIYFKRLSKWSRLSNGEDNYWTENPEAPVNIFTKKNVLIDPTANSSLVNALAPFQTRGMVGNTLAMFGLGMDNTTGMSLVGNSPGVYFNSYYNNGHKNMAPGYSGNISLDPLTGDYLFSFNDNAASANSLVNAATKMSVSRDGKLGLNTGISNRAWMEERGSVNNACAIFGGEGSGVAIQEHFPSIGFNSYYDGSGGYKSIGAGYGGEIGIDQNSGDFYVTTMKGKPIAGDQPYTLGFTRTFNINAEGNVGINTTDPTSQIEIDEPDNSINATNGLTFTSHYTGVGEPQTTKFNISSYSGWLNGDEFGPAAYLVFQAEQSGVFATVANIDDGGNYHQVSDARFKKDIVNLDQNSMLQKLLLLKPTNYHFLQEKTTMRKSYGFLAQDVEKIFPEFVNTIKDKKMLAYSSFIPVIVSAMQEQQKEIEALKNQRLTSSQSAENGNSDLKKEVSTLTEILEQLQQRVAVVEKEKK